jgi:hypothetical protein
VLKGYDVVEAISVSKGERVVMNKVTITDKAPAVEGAK